MYWKFPNDDSYYVIAGVQAIAEDLEVPLEIIIEKAQTVTIVIDELENISIPIYLKDTQTNTIQKLTGSSVDISLAAGLYENRFFIVFKDPTLSVAENLLTDKFQIHHQKELKELLIKNKGNSVVKKVAIYNILGQKLIEIDDSKELNKKEIAIKTISLSEAIYIVTIETSKGKISKKFL